MMANSKNDTSILAKPIELGSPTIIQILNARSSASAEVLSYLECECDAILECKMCRSMFRSLANFIAHKRIFCQNQYTDYGMAPASSFYEEKGVVTVEPTDPDTDPPRTRSGSHNPKKRKPTRQTVGIVESATTQKNVHLSPINGVTCAVMQTTEQSHPGNKGTNSSDDVTVVLPKDGYPNMSLRRRDNRSKLDLDMEDFVDSDGNQFDGDEDDESGDTTFNPQGANASSLDGTAKSLAMRTDCDVKNLTCLTCNTRYSSIRTLNFHMINSHGKQRKFFPCIYCKNVFSQFWGVIRHLKRGHGMTSEGVNRIREKLRAKVFIRNIGPSFKNGDSLGSALIPEADVIKDEQEALSEKASRQTDRQTASPVPDKSAESKSLKCEICGKDFGKKQYLLLHKVACARKMEQLKSPSKPPETQSPPKSSKPLLFVCKTCNRAFSMRQNMAQHAVACAKKHKLKEAALKQAEETQTQELKPDAKHEESKTEKAENQEAETPDKTEPKKPDTENNEPKLEEADEILMQLSPSDEAKEEEKTPSVESQDTLLQNRPKRNIKPKQFHDGTIRIPEVVKIKSADGSLVYKLREDVEGASGKNSGTSTKLESLPQKDGHSLDLLSQGQTVPTFAPDDEAKIERIIDIKRLSCLKCNKEYGSISNLRRHAVRHLGWRRFKCKLCKFTSYNKSECKTHLRKCHPKETATLLDSGLHPFIVDLGSTADEAAEETATAQVTELVVTLPSSNNSTIQPGSSSRSPKTRSQAKEDKPAKDDKSEPQSIDTDSQQSVRETATGTLLSAAILTSNKKSPLMVRKAEISPSSSGSDMPKLRGRPRKHQLTGDSDSEPMGQDENTAKKAKSKEDGQLSENDGIATGSPQKTDQAIHKLESELIKPKESKLENVLNSLKTRKPLSGTEDNACITNGHESTEDNSNINISMEITGES